MKCLKGPVPRVVATASGEAAADQEMAHLLLAQELSGISRTRFFLEPSAFSGRAETMAAHSAVPPALIHRFGSVSRH